MFDLNEGAIWEAFRVRISKAVKEEMDRTAKIAYEHAPVRKIFNQNKLHRMLKAADRRAAENYAAHPEGRERPGTQAGRLRRTFRTLSQAEMDEETPLRQSLGMAATLQPGEHLAPGRTTTGVRFSGRWADDGHLMRGQIAANRLSWGKADLRVYDAQRSRLATKDISHLLSHRGAYEVRNAARRGSVSEWEGNKSFSSGRLFAPQEYVATSILRVGGNLKHSVRADRDVTENGTEISGSVTAGGILGVDYAKYVEFGTRHAPAQPFLRPALNSARRTFPRTLARELRLVGGRVRP